MNISSTDLYIWMDGQGILVPTKYVYEYLDSDGSWKEVTNAVGYEILKLRTSDPAEKPNLDGFNTTTFDEVTTTAFRVTVYKPQEDENGIGLVEWRVFGYLQKVSEPYITTDPVDTSAVANDASVSITISSAVTGSAIYYTFDNTVPTSNSTLYSGEMFLATSDKNGNSVVLKTVAIKDGWLVSNIVEKTITFLPAEIIPEPTPIPTVVPTPTPTDVPVPTPTEVPVPTPTDVPVPTPTDVPTPTPTDEPTPTPTIPIPTPTDVPTPTPTDVPTPTPTNVPTPTPTDVPTPTPTDVPTQTPTDVPTPTPTDVPTPTPTNVPTPTPTNVPTPIPTDVPTPIPTDIPTPIPTDIPTPIPTDVPTPIPTSTPNYTAPTSIPTPTPVVEIITEGDNQASASLTIKNDNSNMYISVHLNKEQIVKLLNGAVTSGKDIEIPMITQNLINQLKNNKVTKLFITVTMSDDLLTNEKIVHSNLNLPTELLEVAKASGFDILVSVVNENGKERYSWSFNGKNLEGVNVADINLSLSTSKVTEHPALGGLLTDAEDIKNGVMIRLNQDGSLPTQASVKIYVGNLTDIRSQAIYLYHYNPTTDKLETLPYSSSYYVDYYGYLTINLINGTDYVMLTHPAAQAVVSSLLNQVVVTPLNKTLYIGGTEDTETNINIALPPTLEVVSSFKYATTNRIQGAVTLSFKSDNDKVATVDSNGMIKAVGAGTTNIVTTTTLYNNKSMSVITKITVKKAYIKITRSTETMKLGDNFTFEVKVYGLNTDNIVWKTAKKSVVSIIQNGNAYAESKGTDYVIIQVGNITKKLKVTVK